jgi:hypothetical protein
MFFLLKKVKLITPQLSFFAKTKKNFGIKNTKKHNKNNI